MDVLKLRKKAVLRNRIVSLTPFAACLILMILYIIGATMGGYDLKIGFKNVISNVTLVALVATGATFIFTSGSFDLSLGTNMLVSAMIGGLVGIATNSVMLMFLTCILVAIGISVVNAVLSSIFNLPVFITTIAMLSVLGSISKMLATQYGVGAAIKVTRTLVADFNNTGVRIFVLVLFEIVCCVLFYFMKLGRKQKFLGGNPECARLSGIHWKKLTILSFVLAGFGIGLAAFSMIAITPTLSKASGASVGMNMLIALVFGGMNVSGGPKSKMFAALLGAFSMAFLDAFMNLFVTGDWYLQLTKGFLFLAVVFFISINNRTKLLER
jgi:ribose transport system permease protein